MGTHVHTLQGTGYAAITNVYNFLLLLAICSGLGLQSSDGRVYMVG